VASNSLSPEEQAVLKTISTQIVDRCRAVWGAFLSVGADEKAQEDVRNVLRDGGKFRVVVDLHENQNAVVALVLDTHEIHALRVRK